MFEDAFDLETALVPDNASINQLPVEILAEIFVHCIPPLIPLPDKLPGFTTHPRQIRATLAQVCRFWCTVLDGEPRVWGTLALDYSDPDPEIVSLWLMKSKSCLLDVFIDPYEWKPRFSDDDIYDDPVVLAISALVYNELTRIRSLFTVDIFMQTFSTFPKISDGHTILPKMESLNLLDVHGCDLWCARFSFPQLRTLVLSRFDMSIDGFMPNVHHLDITEDPFVDTETINGTYKLLQIVPNLVSLTWSIHVFSEPLLPPVVLPFLKILSLPSFGRCQSDTLCALGCLVAPSLENLDLDFEFSTSPDHEVMLKEGLNVICRNESVRLRHLTLRGWSPNLTLVNCRAISPHLDHLDTFTICDSSPND